MNRTEQIQFLNEALLAEMPEYRGQAERLDREEDRRYLLRCLMNLRMPGPLPPRFLQAQDALLSAEREARGVVHVEDLTPIPSDNRIILWQGDITRLDADAIVNAANSQLLGCFRPGHNCIDNVIHSAAGLQLREECAALMRAQGHEEPTGTPSSQAATISPQNTSCTPSGPSSPGPCGRRTGRCWPPAIAPAWSWQWREA